MKKYILIFILLFTSTAIASEFEEAFDMSVQGFSRQADRVVAYLDSNVALDTSQQKREFDYISTSLTKMESEYKFNPAYWFVRGLNVKNLISFYLQLNEGKKTSALVKQRNKYYAKAMAVDKKYGPHLSARAYSAMKSALSSKLKQQAIEAELGLGGSGEYDSYYWYLHWSNVNELQKQGRLVAADKALATMKKELRESSQEENFTALVRKIEQQLKRKTVVSSRPNEKQSAVRSHSSFTEDGMDGEYYRYVIIILGLMLGLAIIAVVFELKRRKNK